MQSKLKKFIFLFSFFSFSFLTFNFCEGAILYLDSLQEKYHSGDTFIVNLRIDTEGECINTVKAVLKFPQDILTAIDFSQGNSILSVWLENPKIDHSAGLISFIGGVPAGFCGKLAGDPGLSNLLGKIIFKVEKTESNSITARFDFTDTSQVLLNDGFGTIAKTSFKGLSLQILTSATESVSSQWQKELENDNILPEPFEVEVQKYPSVFEGKYFIVFSTTDKQTGIDHYEVQENLPGLITKNDEWQRAESPYVLKNQSLTASISVKAIDKAGNERIMQLPATNQSVLQEKYFLQIIFGVGIMMLAVILVVVFRKIIQPKLFLKNEKKS